MVIQSHPPFTQNMRAQMEVWNWKCCLKSHYSLIGQINELTSRPMCSEVKSSFLHCHLGKSSSLNCHEDNITSLENVHRWIVLSLAIVVPGQNVHRWIVVMWTSTETCSSLNLWDQSCHLARQKCSTLNVRCIWSYDRNMFIAEPMRPKLSPRYAKKFNAEWDDMHMATTTSLR